jgi:uncharacterized protein YhaN
MDNNTPKKEDVLTEEEKNQINRDIDDARSKIVSRDVDAKIQQAKEEARREAEKELGMKQKLDELEKAKKELESKMETKEKEYAESFGKLKTKVDELVSSKAPIQMENPFSAPQAGAQAIDRMTDDQIEKIEDSSAREFFGPDYDDRV